MATKILKNANNKATNHGRTRTTKTIKLATKRSFKQEENFITLPKYCCQGQTSEISFHNSPPYTSAESIIKNNAKNALETTKT